LYPRKDINAKKEKIVQGKKPIMTKKKHWFPIEDNPFSIGSSLAFASPQQNVTPLPIEVAGQAEVPVVSPKLQQETMDVTEKETTAIPLEVTTSQQDNCVASQIPMEQIEQREIEQNDDSTALAPLLLISTVHGEEGIAHQAENTPVQQQ
jgi:hypothetical protein